MAYRSSVACLSVWDYDYSRFVGLVMIEMEVEDLLLSHSGISDFQHCERYYRLGRIQMIDKKVKGVALHIGSAHHSFKDAVYAGGTVQDGLEAMEESFLECNTSLMTKEKIGDWEVEKARILAITKAWADIYLENDRARYVEFLPERHFEMDLFPGVKYHGYIDCLVKDRDDNWWILETKTAAKATINEDYFDRLSFDNQVVGYMHLAREFLGFFPAGVIYDVSVKTSHRKLVSKGETTQQFCRRIRDMYLDPEKRKELFIRRHILIGSHNLDSWLRNIRHVAGRLYKKYQDGEDKPGGFWPKSTNQCIGKYGACKFLSICQKGFVNPDIYEKRERYVAK